MIILACDTSSILGSVAVSRDRHILASRTMERSGSHSDTLNAMIHECLQTAGITLNQVDVFASGIGPGSFTGIRIGLNTIKTFSYVYEKPTYGENSLLLMAEAAREKGYASVTVMLNAFKNMLYFAEYRSADLKQLEVVLPPQVVRVQELDKLINLESVIVGEGYLAYQKYLDEKFHRRLQRQESLSDYPSAEILCKQAANNNQFLHWSELIPLYLRASEAEENLQGIKYQSL